jgi:hypothetical protein
MKSGLASEFDFGPWGVDKHFASRGYRQDAFQLCPVNAGCTWRAPEPSALPPVRWRCEADFCYDPLVHANALVVGDALSVKAPSIMNCIATRDRGPARPAGRFPSVARYAAGDLHADVLRSALRQLGLLRAVWSSPVYLAYSRAARPWLSVTSAMLVVKGKTKIWLRARLATGVLPLARPRRLPPRSGHPQRRMRKIS